VLVWGVGRALDPWKAELELDAGDGAPEFVGYSRLSACSTCNGDAGIVDKRACETRKLERRGTSGGRLGAEMSWDESSCEWESYVS
jgi:hypothetical protein